MRHLILAIVTLFMLAGCTATEQGAVIGGASGAAIGGATTGNVGGALVGGAVGAGVGALIGRHAETGMCVYENRWGYRYYAICPR
jgi:hypothetical protein